jgi:transposase, IS6 family
MAAVATQCALWEVLQLCWSALINWADMVLAPSVAGLFKWRQFEPEVILLAVGWYLRFSLSYRDVEELLAERGLHADHVTVWRWVQRYGPEIQRRLRPRLRPTNDSWRVDETYIRVKGKWVYLYRAVDSAGATIDFLLSAKRGAAAAERFLAKALGGANHTHPRVINTDNYAAYPPAIVQLKDEGVLEENCQHRPVQYLNNVLEQDHRAIKRRARASQHFRSFWGAWRTIAGYEAIHKRAAVRRVRRSVYCTASFSVCSRHQTKLPIIYPNLRLNYKVATHPAHLVFRPIVVRLKLGQG